jgi:hypothetical protein
MPLPLAPRHRASPWHRAALSIHTHILVPILVTQTIVALATPILITIVLIVVVLISTLLITTLPRSAATAEDPTNTIIAVIMSTNIAKVIL